MSHKPTYEELGQMVRELEAQLRAAEKRLEALHDKEIKYKSLVDNIPGMVYRGFPDWSSEIVSGSRSLCGYSEKELNSLDKNWLALIHPEDKKKVYEQGQELLKRKTDLVQTYRIIAKGGKTKWVEDRKTSLFSKDGEFIGIDGIVFDITERKKIEEELRNRSEKIKLFAYSVAHDLKTPAIAIHGLARLLNKSHTEGLSKKGKNFCVQIVQISKQLLDMIDKINVFIATGETPLTIEKISLKEVLRVVHEQFSSQLADRSIQWQEPQNLPELIAADRLSLLRILRNLVDNALKHGGEGLSRIVIAYKETPEHHILSITDDGKGIQREDSNGIFGWFKRQISAKGEKGTGLGLAIVREIAGQHKGRAWVDPKAQRKGITFHISISKDL